MPALFSLGQHNALEAIAAELLPTETLCAFLDDIYVVCRPERVATVYALVERHLYEHAGIKLNTGKTKVYNTGGTKPEGVDALQPPEPEAERVWVGDRSLPEEQQGVLVLGAPVGIQAFADKHGEDKPEGERKLLKLVAELSGLQCAWNLLLLCCRPQATYHLRAQPPAQVRKYAEGHNQAL